VPPPEADEPPATTHRASSVYAHAPASAGAAPRGPLETRLAAMSAADIRRELAALGVSTAGCVERADFAAALRGAWQARDAATAAQQQRRERERAAQEAQAAAAAQAAAVAAAQQRAAAEARAREERVAAEAAARRAAAAKQREAEKSNDVIVREVEAWARNKPLYVMINEVNGDKALKRLDTLAVVTKAYRRAILLIHPDKHMDDPARFVRATEMFKNINSAYQTYKEAPGRR
jgi:hypothetical protein